MNAWKAVELMGVYNNCPDCGSEKLGNGEGTLEIEDDTFKRTCKCGWSVEIKV
jgi:transcription elongation factor Elf1